MNETIIIECAHCGTKFKTIGTDTARRQECPACHEEFIIPAASAPQPTHTPFATHSTDKEVLERIAKHTEQTAKNVKQLRDFVAFLILLGLILGILTALGTHYATW